MLDIKDVFLDLQAQVPEAQAVLNEGEAGDPSITVNKDQILKVCETLRDGKGQFHALQVISGVDYPEYVEVSYMLCNFEQGQELILKTNAQKPEGNELPQVPTVCSVWGAANFQERETYDMLGVQFVGHPDLRRILCCYDWEGYPLRKDYVAAKEYHGMDIYPEAKSNKEDIDYVNVVKAEEKKKLDEEKALKAKVESAVKLHAEEATGAQDDSGEKKD